MRQVPSPIRQHLQLPARNFLERGDSDVGRKAKIDARNNKVTPRIGESASGEIPDQTVITACAQACPAEAIVFGDQNDANSRVAKLKASPRNYGMLTDLNTLPRTTYLAAVRNPNPEMPKANHG